VTGNWGGKVGVVTNLIKSGGFDRRHTTAFVCGPEVMMRYAAEALVERGTPRESVWLSMERNMKCAVGFCGHCQFGPTFVCRDGPVYRYDALEKLLTVWEL
jgi:NAD(P)H-flavin reductase